MRCSLESADERVWQERESSGVWRNRIERGLVKCENRAERTRRSGGRGENETQKSREREREREPVQFFTAWGPSAAGGYGFEFSLVTRGSEGASRTAQVPIHRPPVGREDWRPWRPSQPACAGARLGRGDRQHTSLPPRPATSSYSAAAMATRVEARTWAQARSTRAAAAARRRASDLHARPIRLAHPSSTAIGARAWAWVPLPAGARAPADAAESIVGTHEDCLAF